MSALEPVHKESTQERLRWQAVLNRDAVYDGQFVFAVSTTRVFCRPSCPARHAKREHVVFFNTASKAEAAGFRACFRCRPNENGGDHKQADLVHRVCAAIDEDLSATPTLGQLSRQFHISPHKLQRTFKSVMGITLRHYTEGRRMKQFKSQVRNGNGVTDAMYEAGFSSSSRLYEKSNAHLGMTPKTYRRGGIGMKIEYSIVDSPLGRLLVGGTERGICAIYMGNSDAHLISELRQEYPEAAIQEDRSRLKPAVMRVLEHVQGSQPNLNLPLDLQATAFQMKVWKKLQSIPYGSTRTYSQIARSLGRPSSSRAVARACATNPVSILIPCHRVIRRDGNLAGYRWGLPRKKQLLETEKAHVK
ncbi:MAG: bifunctional DNA-binding transcriptional regulator/O6-methylguanine-DNA methyltransferase Ada [Acidobacteriia bacterium]|nr:bifunctional DNA-binding transcriptional regulator/O6-methylguanine-DNA methyltransferase Ada [Terriglobia bacterium]